MNVRIYTCNDCRHYEETARTMSTCDIDDKCHYGWDELCPFFLTKDGRQPRFCKMAGDVDKMAEELITDGYTREGDDGFVFIPSGKIFLNKDLAVEAAKKWLMECE